MGKLVLREGALTHDSIILESSVGGKGLYLNNTTGVKSYIRQEGTGGEIAIGSDNGIYFKETDADITKITFTTNDGAGVFTGNLTANSFIKSGGTSSQFLKADGSVDTNTYLTTETDTLDSVIGRNNTTTKAFTSGLHTISNDNANYQLHISQHTGTGYAPASILLEATQSTSRGQGLYHYNTLADESWFTGIPYSVASARWIIAHKSAEITWSADVAQTSNELFGLDTSGNGLFSGTLTANSFIKLGGTSTQFLKADGSVDTNTYLTTDNNTTYTSSLGISLSGTNFTPTYGTAANTIAQGNDSRINNGQTAFTWGDHALGGYSTTGHTHTFDSLTSKPTTLGGYAITDAYTKTTTDTSFLPMSYTDVDMDVNFGDKSLLLGRNIGGWASGTKPSGSHNGFGILHVTTHTGGYATQFGFDSNQNKMWVRSRNPTTWGSWVNMWTSSDFSNNSSNWNTAYGWGDHALGGYLTSETDTLQTVTDRGATSTTTINPEKSEYLMFSNSPLTGTGGIHLTPGVTTNGHTTAITFSGQPNLKTAAQAAISVWSSTASGTEMGFYTTDSFAAGPKIAAIIKNTGDTIFVKSVQADSFKKYLGTSDDVLLGDGTTTSKDALVKSPVGGNHVDGLWQGTQAEYDAIGTPDPNTIYFIV